jgi:hypothetical protein
MLNRDYVAFIQSLNDNRVRYLVVGGYAAILHGYPRRPKNLDIWIEASPENARRMMEAIAQLGKSPLGFTEADFKTKDQIIQIEFSTGRRAIINTLNGIEFGACFETRIQKKSGPILVEVIALEHLRIDKSNLWTVTGLGRT